MSLGRRLRQGSEGFLDRVLCVVGAVVFSQAPEFFQQYLQRLGGHLDEARRQLAQFEATARQSGITLARLIERTDQNADAAVAKLGAVMTSSIARVHELQSAHDALLHASVWSRPVVFVRVVDPAIANATRAVFQPAVPTTTEGLVYAVCGMLVFIALYHGGIKTTGRWVQRRWSRLRSAISTAPVHPYPPPPSAPPPRPPPTTTSTP